MSTGSVGPRHAAPLEPGEFGIAFQLALDAGQGPDRPGAATPWARASLALEAHFPDDADKRESAEHRFRALMDLYTRDSLGPWVRDAGGAARTEIHPAVLDVASRMRLADNGRFPVRKFLERVGDTARRNYSDLAEWPIAETSAD